ncbi:LysR family transcriptional regulator [Vibrio sonorensis]|uniref:LysR family transcriptional regulator n=1 Tax=Vibrio sonorensis TaxID=1004316 RepID=UPI0008DA32FD|nr:LysR family transcriptional regulator [Vibrio sonorensis]
MHKMHKRFERYVLFGEVAKQLSFSKAAENLGISRSYLSSQIGQLEAELKTSLLIRSTRSVRLTAAGEKILAKMNGINSAIVELEKELDHNKNEVEGVLRITAPTIFSHRYLVDICCEFQHLHPNISFDLDIGYQRVDLAKSHFDLAIRATNQPPENMVAKKLMPYQHLCCASPDYLAKNGTPTHPDQLAHHNCMSDPNLRKWQFSSQGKTLHVETDGDMLISDNLLLLDAAIKGKGLIKLPCYLVEEALEDGRLVQVLSDYYIASSNIYLIYPPQLRTSTKLTAFIDFVHNWFHQSKSH